MDKEILEKKLDQLGVLIRELKVWLDCSFDEFQKDDLILRAAERNFQLIVDIGCAINTRLLLAKGMSTPETYKQSFTDMGKAGIVSIELADRLAEGAKLRNILVHEYDFVESDEKFYESAKKLLPAYEEYARAIYAHIEKKTD